MRAGPFLVGLALLLAALIPLTWGAVVLRRRLLPGWGGGPARLGDAVLLFALLFLVEEATGMSGLFDRTGVVAGSALTGLAVAMLAGRKSYPRDAQTDPAPQPDRASVLVALVVGAVVAGIWGARVAASYSGGIVDVDSLEYHLPTAARFVQTGSITSLHFLDPQSVNLFHPANSELLHALGMITFGRDVLTPVINLVWVGLMLLAAWCIGRPWGAGPASMAGTSVLLVAPITAIGAGSALNDVPSLFFLLAAAALLLQPAKGRGVLAVAGAAAGVAIGTKVTVVPAIAALSLGLLVWRGANARRDVVTGWVPAVAATGSFWYLRNLVRSSSPVPHLQIGIGGWRLVLPQYEQLERFGYSVAHYIARPGIWRTWFIPGLHVALSPAWAAILFLSLAGAGLAIVRPRTPVMRIIGATAIVALLVYLATPTTALGPEGQPSFFALNVRYAFPGLAIGLALLPCAAVIASTARQRAVMGAYVVILLVTLFAGGALPGGLGTLRTWAGGHTIAAVVVFLGVIAVSAVLVAVRRGRLPRLVAAVALAGLLAASTMMLFHLQSGYVRTRYRDWPQWAWADGLRDKRIGVVNRAMQYPFYGRELSNYVQYVGRTGPRGAFRRASSCSEWVGLLEAGNYEYVVLADGEREVAWTRSNPAAHQLISVGGTTVFVRRAPWDPTSCPT